MFRRRGERGADVPPAEEPAAEPALPPALVVGESAAPAAGSRSGPYDITQAPPDGPARLDLGVLQLPTPDGVEIRVEADPGTREAYGVVLITGEGQLHLSVFAAPKSAGLWPDVRREIVAALVAGGGSGQETPGRFGVQIVGRSVSEVPGRGRVAQPVRLLGVDGPRWFLRGTISGRAAAEPTAAQRFEEMFAEVVVARGSSPMAPREPLALVLPAEVRKVLGIDVVTDGRPVIDIYTRGPEITETR